MKATVIMGSPRGERGASTRAAKQFSSGLKRAGAIVTEIMLKDHKINHCIGCYTCWTKTPGKCIHRDDMDSLLPLWNTDLIVWATPLYYYSVPGIVKDVIDRQLPLVEPFLVEKENTTSHPRRGGQTAPATFLICTAGFPEQSHFDTLIANFKKFNSNYLGDIMIGGSETMSFPEFQESYKDLYSLIEKAGYETGTLQAISGNTKKALLEKIIYSPEKIKDFRNIANDYWKSLIVKKIEPDKNLTSVSGNILKITDPGMASFMAGMAMSYNPSVDPGFSGVIQFEYESESYHLLITNNICKAYKGKYPTPSLTIISPEKVWLDVSGGVLNGNKAYMDGLYKTTGDLNILMRINQMFRNAGTGTENNNTGQLPRIDEKIPEHRGPFKLKGMTWLTIAFLPWMIQWIWGSITAGLVPVIAAAGLAVLIAAYHLITNKITLFEAGTAMYLTCSVIIQLSGWNFFTQYGFVINYIFLGGLWLASIARRFNLTAEYSRYQYPKPVWNTPAFIMTNTIICAAWGVYYLIAAVLRLMISTGSGPETILILLSFILLIPMFIFTGRFQKWYPVKMMQKNQV